MFDCILPLVQAPPAYEWYKQCWIWSPGNQITEMYIQVWLVNEKCSEQTTFQRKQNCASTDKRIPPGHTNNYLPWTISLEIYWSRIILLHTHLQVVYCNCVKFHQFWVHLSSAYKTFGQTDTQTDRTDRQDRVLYIYPCHVQTDDS